MQPAGHKELPGTDLVEEVDHKTCRRRRRRRKLHAF
jgi:hypothetical protein